MNINLVCPITGKIFNEPVVDATGTCYERQAVEHNKYTYFPVHILREQIQCLLASGKIKKEDIYVVNKTYTANKQQIENSIFHKSFDDLLEYTNFVLSDMIECNMIDRIFGGGNIKCVQHVLDNCIDINDVDDMGRNIIYYLLKYEYQDIIVKLTNVDINHVDNNGNTVLTHELYKSSYNTSKITWLLNNGIDVTLQPYLTYIQHRPNSVEIIDLLLSKGADINETRSDSKMTLFLYAVKSFPRYIIEHLHKKGANVHVSDNRNNNALHYACSNDRPIDILEYLVTDLKISTSQHNYDREKPFDLLDHNYEDGKEYEDYVIKKYITNKRMRTN